MKPIQAVHWAGAFAVYGGHGTTGSSTIVYEIEPGHRLGWHTDATEETHYIIAGTGESHTEDGSSYPGRPWQYFCDSNAGKTHLVNVGKGNIARRCFLRGCVLLKTSAT